MIPTGARPSEALQARWEEIDFDKRLWTLPAERAKTLREHVVPLSSLALEVLQRRLAARTGDMVFGGPSGSRRRLRQFPPVRRARPGSRPGRRIAFGARSFRDWCGDIGRIDHDLAEAAPAHSLGAVEASYRRASAVDARRPVKEAFAKWLTGDARPTSSPFRRAPELA